MVLGIIALIMTLALRAIGGAKGTANLTQADIQMKQISGAMNGYKMHSGTGYPTTAQGLEALVTRPSSSPSPKRWTKQLEEVPKDPWDNELRYKREGSGFFLQSAGEDEIFDTEDDLKEMYK